MGLVGPEIGEQQTGAFGNGLPGAAQQHPIARGREQMHHIGDEDHVMAIGKCVGKEISVVYGCLCDALGEIAR